MNVFFYIAAVIAIIATIMAISGRNAIHSLLYLILSLLAISVIFYLLSAPFIAALEVIIYAGAIMVLFIFVVMMLNIGSEREKEYKWLSPRMWIVPVILASILLIILIIAMNDFHPERTMPGIISPKQVGISMFTTYILAVEVTGILLLAGITGAYHLGKQKKKVLHRFMLKVPVEKNEKLSEKNI